MRTPIFRRRRIAAEAGPVGSTVADQEREEDAPVAFPEKKEEGIPSRKKKKLREGEFQI